MISPLSKSVMSSHDFFLAGKQGGLCAQEMGTWAWIHHAQVPWGGYQHDFPGQEALGGFSAWGGFPAFYTSTLVTKRIMWCIRE